MKANLQAEARALSRVEYLIATNQGTYGAAEAVRCVGSGDPAFADRFVYETVGGDKRTTGPSHSRAPGYMRDLNREAIQADRRRLADLRKQMRRNEPARGA